ncbi:hypothetical protein SAMN05443572_101470 [Myxococcus fulvus]|uniref:Uncharacterized protein n=1 Tax=Myxococcus fulvus TaxID=33 RepID=A0A511T068_MYXFU|nr:hypothetical protein [Myxococcus fulvus]GEN07515.1 hypothetical protein MFU01_25520 [Myxococcus fulvus]SES88402.1 hypothetical protein SAMN05443572_101470 [Myxococcus fulvus]
MSLCQTCRTDVSRAVFQVLAACLLVATSTYAALWERPLAPARNEALSFTPMTDLSVHRQSLVDLWRRPSGPAQWGRWLMDGSVWQLRRLHPRAWVEQLLTSGSGAERD